MSDSFQAEYWNSLFREGIGLAKKYVREVAKDLAPKGYLPLMNPQPRAKPEDMGMEEFLALTPEQQRYVLRRNEDSAG